MGSRRLPGKMLMDLGGKPLVRWAVDAAVKEFGYEHTVAAIPASEENDELAAALAPYVRLFRWDGPEKDVLGRFNAVANTYRWHPSSVIWRGTCDDPFKDGPSMRRVALGERLPVEIGGEAFLLGALRMAHDQSTKHREHLTPLFHTTDPPKAPPGIWTVDTLEDLIKARHRVTREALVGA
jgi:spore coat polysaccharide biosynthesis protein SpsF (cytidylyltransferase family)